MKLVRDKYSWAGSSIAVESTGQDNHWWHLERLPSFASGFPRASDLGRVQLRLDWHTFANRWRRSENRPIGIRNTIRFLVHPLNKAPERTSAGCGSGWPISPVSRFSFRDVQYDAGTRCMQAAARTVEKELRKHEDAFRKINRER